MKRAAFNGEELPPGLALRSDMDVYMHDAQTLESFGVSGMRPFADALEDAHIDSTSATVFTGFIRTAPSVIYCPVA